MATVVICDDDRMIRMVLATALTRRGHEVSECSDSDELLALVEQRQFDLCIMDLEMPGISYEDRLRQMETLAPGMPVIVLSGRATSAAERENDRVLHLRKPIDLATFESALAELGVA